MNELLIAVRDSNIEEIKNLLVTVVNVNEVKESNGKTAMHIAAENGELDILQLLINSGGNINATDTNGHSLLTLASYNGRLSIVHWLIVMKADLLHSDNNGFNSAHCAVQQDHLPILELLVSTQPELFNTFTNTGDSLVTLASYNGRLSIVQWLIMMKADLLHSDNNGLNSAHCAVQKDHQQVLELLVSTKPELLNTVTHGGQSLLTRASYKGRLSIVQWLIMMKADLLHSDNKGLNSAHWAVQQDHQQVLELLVSTNPELLNTITNGGHSLLTRASYRGRLSIVQWLIMMKADLLYSDKKGFNSAHWAVQHDHLPVLELLVSTNPELLNIVTNGGC